MSTTPVFLQRRRMMTLLEQRMTHDLLTRQSLLTESHGSPLPLLSSSLHLGAYFYFSLSSFSQDIWEAMNLKLMVSWCLESLPSFQVSMRHELLIIRGGVQQVIDLLPFLTTRVIIAGAGKAMVGPCREAVSLA